MDGTKLCIRCNLTRPITDYYKHKEMTGGHLTVCKDCVKKRVSIREKKLRQDPNWVEKEKERGREKYYRLGYKDTHKPKDSYSINKKHRAKYPEKYKAKCSMKGLTREGLEAHHWSYNLEHYKDVIFLSTKDHYFLHRYMQYDQERMKYRVQRVTDSFSTGELLDTKERHLKFLSELIESTPW